MKTELTKEQSQHLLDLGISKYEADWKVIGIDVDHSLPLETLIEKSQVEPHFTLVHLFELLPKEIGHWNFLQIMVYGENWIASYNTNLKVFNSEELIDALYELCVWCIENGYLKFDK